MDYTNLGKHIAHLLLKEDLEIQKKIINFKESFETPLNKKEIIKEFIKFSLKELKLKKVPQKLTLSRDTSKAKEYKTFGTFNPELNEIWIYTENRNCADILRTLAHELVHFKQKENNQPLDGSTGSNIENEANALAGELLRKFGKINNNIYEGLVKEIGDSKPYNWEYKGIDDENNVYYSFDTPKNNYSAAFSYLGDDAYDYSFNTVGEMGLDTNENVVLQIMATIVDICLDFIKKHSPSEITIHPIKTKDSIDDKRRSKIYGYYLEKNIPSDYKLIKLGDNYKVIKK